MRKIFAFVASAAFVAAMAAPMFAQATTIKGEVVDVACATKGRKGEAHSACAMKCAKAGQPAGIMTADATYVIVGDYAANSNAKLLDFVAKNVEVTGTVTEKDGQKQLTIKTIKLAN